MVAGEKNEIKLLRSKDVAQILNMCPDDVLVLARKGEIKAIKKGRYWRFPLNEILDYKQKIK